MQTWNANGYAEHAHFVPTLGQPVLELLDPKPGERILDLGCGDGVLSEKLAALGALVIGADSSPQMVEAAKQRGVDARVMDGYHLSFDSEFDGVFSNAALHWMSKDPNAVIAGVRRALKPGGRFAGEMGGHGNVAAITVALIAVLQSYGVADPTSGLPWFFPTIDDYRTRLDQHGFDVEYIELIPRPTPLPTDMAGWLKTFGMPFFQRLPEVEHASALEKAVELLRPVLCDEKGKWTGDYVRLRFLARANRQTS
jgi:trans-aconitate methyltransferase